MLIDITRPIYSGMPVYPGDPEVRIESLSVVNGADYALSQLFLSLHSGTHIDAPSHVIAGGKTVDQLGTERLVLRAHVVDTLPSRSILTEHLPAAMAKGDALLFRNLGLPGAEAYTAPRVDISQAAARQIVEAGISLIGTECMDVEQEDSVGLPVHKILLGAGVLIVENLDLSATEPGIYRLFCFPLILAGAEASPCRAVLETLA